MPLWWHGCYCSKTYLHLLSSISTCVAAILKLENYSARPYICMCAGVSLNIDIIMNSYIYIYLYIYIYSGIGWHILEVTAKPTHLKDSSFVWNQKAEKMLSGWNWNLLSLIASVFGNASNIIAKIKEKTTFRPFYFSAPKRQKMQNLPKFEFLPGCFFSCLVSFRGRRKEKEGIIISLNR